MRKDERRAGVALLASLAVMMGDNLFLGGNHYYVVSAILVLISLVPFLIPAGPRRKHTRELVFLVFLVLLTVLFRLAFDWLPSFKPLAAVIFMAGMAMGATGGLLVGFWSIFLSDFVCGFGPWAPWQMLAYGFAGLIAGVLANHGRIPRWDLSLTQKIAVTLLLAVFVVAVIGPILDTCALAMMPSVGTGKILDTYWSGLPVNASQALAASIAFFLLANPVLEKLARARQRFGLMDWDRASRGEVVSRGL